MIITIKDYLNRTMECGVGNLEDINMMTVHVVSGDELLKVLYKNGSVKSFDSCDVRTTDYYDGDYVIYNCKNSTHLINSSKWLAREDAYDGLRQNSFMCRNRNHRTEIQVGDIVKVVDCGKCYTTYAHWFEVNDVPRELCVRFMFGKSMKEGTTGTVQFIAPHEHFDTTLCLIKNDIGDCYLISESGLEHCGKELD